LAVLTSLDQRQHIVLVILSQLFIWELMLVLVDLHDVLKNSFLTVWRYADCNFETVSERASFELTVLIQHLGLSSF
jgi:hypothetical protein